MGETRECFFMCYDFFISLDLEKVVSFVRHRYFDAHRNLLQSRAKLRLNTEISMRHLKHFFPSHLDFSRNCFPNTLQRFFSPFLFCFDVS